MKKKKEAVTGLIKVVNELSNVSQSHLNETLLQLGYNPDELAAEVRSKIQSIKQGRISTIAATEKKKTFDPLLVAASLKSDKRRENALKKLKKRPKKD